MGRRGRRPGDDRRKAGSMSASRIQKLEALLERVQDNRNKPRAISPSPSSHAKPAPSASPLEAAMQDLGVVAPKPSSRPPKPTPAARPSVKPEPRPEPPKPKPEPAVMKAPPRPKPVAPVRPKPVAAKPVTPKPAQPISLEPTPPAASGPVAAVASEPETTSPATFGSLLDRTLKLRPR